MDTIYALASAPGRAGVAVIRVSGPLAHSAAAGLAGSDLPARGMSLRTLRDRTGDILDEALVLTFSGPNSFTGEDVAEFQVHGSIAGVSSVLTTLSQTVGLRQAEPGEFTRRALENGRMDLAQVEGLADLIDAETEAQRRQAQTLLSGRLGDIAEGWRTKLIRAAALIEATLDFADEDVPQDVTPEVRDLLNDVRNQIAHQADGVGMAERIRSGFEVAIVGSPNVGKSTLLNTLSGREAAITSEWAGTTRDVIEVRMDLDGLPVTLLDTAGLRETDDEVESIGIARAKQRAENADLRVFLAEPGEVFDVAAEDGDIRILPKGDQRADRAGSISGLTGDGVDDLVQQITGELTQRSAGAGIATRQRHREALVSAKHGLGDALACLDFGAAQYDIAAEDIRRVIRSLESLVGRIDVETLLDEIFASFCLGK